MERILIEEPMISQISLFDVDWDRLIQAPYGPQMTTRMTSIISESETSQTAGNLMKDLGSKILLESDVKNKEDMVTRYVTGFLGDWIGVSPSEIDLEASLYSHGIDSFFALTLKMRLETTLDMSFEVWFSSNMIA